jgi:hypothetical protein
MGTVNPSDLPYPPGKILLTPSSQKPIAPGALDAGTAQCLDLTVQEAEGILALYGTWLGFGPDNPTRREPYEWPYATIEGFSLKKGLLLSLVKSARGASMLALTLLDRRSETAFSAGIYVGQ